MWFIAQDRLQRSHVEVCIDVLRIFEDLVFVQFFHDLVDVTNGNAESARQETMQNSGKSTRTIRGQVC